MIFSFSFVPCIMCLLGCVVPGLLWAAGSGTGAVGPTTGPQRIVAVAGQPAVVLRSKGLRASFDDRGDLIALGDGRRFPLLSTTGGGMWRITLMDGRTISARDFAPQEVVGRSFAPDSAVYTYTGSDTELGLHLAVRDGMLEAWLHIVRLPGDARLVALPASLDFDPAQLDHVIYPSEQGVKLRPSFYTRDSTSTRWTMRMAGDAMLREVAGIGCRMVPVTGATDKLTVVGTGRAVLGDSLAAYWEGRPQVVARPPLQLPDITLIDSPQGAFLGGHRVGRGMLLRFGGKVSRPDSPAAVRTVSAFLEAWRDGTVSEDRMPGRSRTVVLDIDHCPAFNGWSETPVAMWLDGLAAGGGTPEGMTIPTGKANEARGRGGDAAASGASRPKRHDAPEPVRQSGGGSGATTVRTMDGLLAALADPAVLAVVNPYGESVPLGFRSAGELTAAVRDFLQRGGVWVETGGYPFFNHLVPPAYNRMHDVYPYAFADFSRIEGRRGGVSLYGVQDARDPQTVFVPLEWETWGDASGGHAGRAWQLFVDGDRGGRTPVVRFSAGRSVEADVAAYRDANGFARPLADKMDSATLETWKRSLLIKYGGFALRDQIDFARYLPRPAVVHVLDFLHGGFDKQYPDHLPPHPSRGTIDDLRALVDTLHAYGHLFMPYTNHTWWSDGPRGEWFRTHGEEALSLDYRGKPMREDYGGNYGWTVCPWHPDVAGGEWMLARQFAGLGSDILFEDQSGARGWIGLDFNPAAPAPHAYQQGLINLSADASRYCPLSTEQGFDRMIVAQSQFAGLTWKLVPYDRMPFWLSFWLRGYRDLLHEDDYEAFPLAQTVAGGDALFAPHLGDPIATGSEGVAWSLVLGYQLFASLWTVQMLDAEYMAWLGYLSDLQRSVAAYYMGTAPTGFRYLSGSGNTGVIEAGYGPMRVVANFSAEPYRLGGDIIIAPKGFYAVSPAARAGYLLRYGRERYDTPRYLIDHCDTGLKIYELAR